MLGITELFHKRQKKLRGEMPDVYHYEKFPQPLKVQIVHIWKEGLGVDTPVRGYLSASDNREMYEIIHKILLKELAVFELRKERYSENPEGKLFITISNYFLNEEDVEKSLSVVELVAKATCIYFEQHHKDSEPFITELNERFKEHGFGYQFDSGQIIRIDSQFIHSEAVKPTLLLLTNPIYENAQREFLLAHDYYKHGDYSKAILECAKAYESTLKVIIKKHNWNYDDRDTADALTGKVVENGLFPAYLNDFFKSLKNTFKVVNTVRNNEAGHGKVAVVPEIPEYLASYVLHMTASVLLFLIKAEEALP